MIRCAVISISDCRRQLLQTMCKHLQYHISHRQEVRLSTDLLGDLLTIVQQLQVCAFSSLLSSYAISSSSKPLNLSKSHVDEVNISGLL